MKDYYDKSSPRFSYDGLKELLSKCFKDVKIVPPGGKILPFLRVSRKAPHFLNRLFGRDFLWRAVKG